MNSIGGLSNKGFSEMVQWFDTRRLSSGLLFGGLSKCAKYSEGCLISEVVLWVSKTKSFCFETSFHTWQIACMRESMKTGHDIDIHIEICIFYMNECE